MLEFALDQPGWGPATIAIRKSADGKPLLEMWGVERSFGITKAVQDVDFEVREAEIVGLMGGNGAGKSTLMKIVGGLVAADRGRIRLFGEDLEVGHSPRAAMRLGVRFVHQELSLSPNLRVYENFAVEWPDLIRGLSWRRVAIERAREALAEVFPACAINAKAKVSSLSLSHQQMVEIARAACHPAARLIIMDEPTSSLGSREAGQLLDFMRRRRAGGTSFIFISHRLRETLELADRVAVMRNGRMAWSGAAGEIGHPELLRLLGGAQGPGSIQQGGPAPLSHDPVIRITSLDTAELRAISLEIRGGEIVGIAGLEGSGQRALLRAVYEARPGVQVSGRAAFVSGDRVREGIFPLWSIDDNIAISGLSRLSRWGFLSLGRLRHITSHWFDMLQIHASDGSAPITSLSGGNQQKVVIARALAADADIIILDDPTRGVDLGTKADLYGLFRECAAKGKAVVWYSTDDAEFVECDRIIIMREGAAVAQLPRAAYSVDHLVEASFRIGGARSTAAGGRGADWVRRLRLAGPGAIPLFTFALIFAVCVALNPNILSSFGMTLVFSAAFALCFAATSQLFMIAAGDIDLGIGPFIGLVNAIAATWLVTDPGLAALCFAALLLAYPMMGLFIQARGVPAIIVTLGMSFVWLGFASLRLPRAGGAAPDWLVDLIKIKTPLLPLPLLLCLAPPVLAYLLLMVWRYGAVLRGFGASPRAVEAAGWSARAAKATLYAFAGLVAFLAGIVITANTRGGDPTGAISMTLLSVAAVILGGASFSGGAVAPIGALFGVLTLVLVGTLLSLLEVNGVFLPLIQGLMLLGVVGIRTLLLRTPT